MRGLDVLVLLPHFSQILHLFDVGPASPIKTAFKEELDKRIGDIAAAPAGEKLQRILKALVESFANGLHRGATPGNIISGFRHPDICPFDPEVPLRTDFAIEAPNHSIFRTISTGTEVNELLFTDDEGFNKLSQIEFRRDLVEEDKRINSRQVWETLTRKTVLEGRPLS
jgi:hypothetical protein